MKPILKWTGIALGAILGLVLVLAGVLWFIGGSKFEGPTDLRAESVALPVNDSAALSWGQHLAETHGCTDCHAADLSGQVLVDAPPFRVVASNLTAGAGGVGRVLDEQGWERAIRHGVGADGRGLAIMPSELYTYLSDDDLGALVAHLRSVPAIDNELPATTIKPLGRIIAATGGFFPTSDLIDHEAPHPETAPEAGATVEYGAYRASTLCSACHGADMNGAQPPDPSSPPAPSLIPAGRWTLEQFTTALRTGQTPARQVDGDYMPYTVTAKLTDAEIEALWLYLGSLPVAPAAPTAQ